MHVIAEYISDNNWQGFEKNKLYLIDLNYYICNGSVSWFAFRGDALDCYKKNPYRKGYIINEHMKYFNIIKEIEE
jgi:hypothetical protein